MVAPFSSQPAVVPYILYQHSAPAPMVAYVQRPGYVVYPPGVMRPWFRGLPAYFVGARSRIFAAI